MNKFRKLVIAMTAIGGVAMADMVPENDISAARAMLEVDAPFDAEQIKAIASTFEDNTLSTEELSKMREAQLSFNFVFNAQNYFSAMTTLIDAKMLHATNFKQSQQQIAYYREQVNSKILPLDNDAYKTVVEQIKSNVFVSSTNIVNVISENLERALLYCRQTKRAALSLDEPKINEAVRSVLDSTEYRQYKLKKTQIEKAITDHGFAVGDDLEACVSQFESGTKTLVKPILSTLR